MAQAKLKVRALDADGEPIYGQGQANFVTDIDALTVLIKKRLLFFQGEWWLNLKDGLALFQEILGTSNPKNSEIFSQLVQVRITDLNDFVTGISNLSVSFDSNKRISALSCSVDNIFSTPIQITYTPGNLAVLPT